jgi:hypothetical protein
VNQNILSDTVGSPFKDGEDSFIEIQVMMMTIMVRLPPGFNPADLPSAGFKYYKDAWVLGTKPSGGKAVMTMLRQARGLFLNMQNASAISWEQNAEIIKAARDQLAGKFDQSEDSKSIS